MKLTKLCECVATLALGIASAASNYSVTLPSDATAGSTQLKAGDYKVQVEGNQATFKQGKDAISVPVSVENNAKAYQFNQIETQNSTLESIAIGGTHLKLVFAPAKSTGPTSAAQ